eukprot:1179548-Prorocentrum_minimum.AAC.2
MDPLSTPLWTPCRPPADPPRTPARTPAGAPADPLWTPRGPSADPPHLEAGGAGEVDGELGLPAHVAVVQVVEPLLPALPLRLRRLPLVLPGPAHTPPSTAASRQSTSELQSRSGQHFRGTRNRPTC